MQGLRDEIRAILREELLSLREEMRGAGPRRETVRIASGADLNRFAQEIAARAADPEFAEALRRGEVVFDLAQPQPVGRSATGAPIVSATGRAAPHRLTKPLITERDLAALGPATQSLAIGRNTRLTPLARDEVRRRGIRIERGET